MIKGCNKRVIVMKDTGNAMIEEAFFILKPEAATAGVTEGDIVKQANRILEKSIYDEKFPRFSGNYAKRLSRGNLSAFLSGAVIGAAVMAGVFII